MRIESKTWMKFKKLIRIILLVSITLIHINFAQGQSYKITVNNLYSGYYRCSGDANCSSSGIEFKLNNRGLIFNASSNQPTFTFNVPNSNTNPFNITVSFKYNCRRSTPKCATESFTLEIPDVLCSEQIVPIIFNGQQYATYHITVELDQFEILSSSSPPTNYCTSEKIKVDASGFPNGYYNWRYKVEGQSAFTTLNSPKTNNSTGNIGLADIFGSNYSNYLGKNIYFQAGIGNCTAESEPYVFNPDKAIPVSHTVTGVGCKGDQNWSINITGTNRAPVSGETYKYVLYDTQSLSGFLFDTSSSTLNSSSVGGLPADKTYYVVIESFIGASATGCGSVVYYPVYVNEPNNALKINPSKADESCRSSNDGSITVGRSGGWGGYTFSKNSTTTYQASNIFSGLAAGSYVMRVKDSGGCVVSTTVTISQPSAELTIGTPEKTNETCRSANDGTITINATGGWGGKTYSKNSTTAYQSSNIFSGLAAGTYTMRVKDSGGCVKSTSVTINQAGSELNIGTPSKTNETCRSDNDGTITISATGGWGGYTYSKNSNSTYQGSNVFPDLTAGTYIMRVKDSGGCVKSASVTISQPATELSIGTPTKKNTCIGTSEGAISIFPSGGWTNLPYKYSINNPTVDGDDNVFTGLAAGTYTMRVKDSGGCVKSTSVTIAEPSTDVTFTTVKTDVLCKGTSSGTITVSPSGGWGGYTYSINSTISFQASNILNAVAGTHIIRVKDSEGCIAQSNVTIDEPANSLTFNYVANQITCQGDDNGTITVTPTGGWGGYQYSKDNGSTYQASNVFTSLFPGQYQIRVKDSGDCETVKQEVIISEPTTVLSLSISKVEVTCKGADDGTINLSGLGGWGGYNYSIDNGLNFQSSGNFSGLIPDTYLVKVRDTEGCETTSQSVIISEPATNLSFSFEQLNVSCKNSGDGSITVTATGGWGDYEYSKDGGSTYQLTNIFSSLVPATYNVKVKDSNGCETIAQTVTITEPDVLTASSVAQGVTCNGGSDGSIVITATGGTSPYEYSLNGSLYQSDNSFTGLVAGTYSIVVKDANGCTTSFSKTVGTPSPIAGSISLISPISCNGDSDGALSVSASGGSGTLTYLWSTGASTSAISGLSANNYSVTITDQNNCFKVLNYVLNEPGLLTIVTESVKDVSCNGGSDAAIDVSITGGTLPYFYSWSEGSTSQDLTGLAVNDYTLSVTDNRGCKTLQTFSISEPEPLDATIQLAKNISCFEGNDGQIVLEAAGGITPYEFSKDGGASWQSETFVNLTANAYTFDVRDANGCTQSISTILTEPTSITIAINNVQNTTCGNPIGGAESVVTGGVAPYQYSWKNASNTEVSTASSMANVYSGIYTIYITDDNGCTKSEVVVISNTNGADISIIGITASQCYSSSDGQATVVINSGVGPFSTLWSNGETTNTATNLTRGNHQVTVTDGNDCETIATVNIPSPLALDYSVITTQSPSCFGEADVSITINASGGTGPYNYLWDTGTVGNSLSGVLAGVYQVTITDDHNCSTTETIVIPETPVLSYSLITEIKPTCIGNSDGILEITGQGGTAPYSYDWGVFGASARVENLNKGIYPVTITDINGCTTLAEVTLNDPEPINLAIITLQQPSCVGQSNGFIEITGTGGTSPYSYLWQNGVTGNQLTNVSAGIYQVTITDNNGCSDIKSVTLNEPTPLILNIIETSSPSCYGFDNGSIEVEAVGGTRPYFFNWSNGTTGATLNDLTAGSYMVNLQDNNGCTTSITIDLSEPEPITLNVTELVLPTCYDTTDGEIAVEVQGGTAPYSYSWNTGVSTPQISNIGQGDYQFTVTDTNNCELQQLIQLQGVEQINLEVAITDPLCFGYDDGQIEMTASGGTGNLVYKFNNSLADPLITGLTAGNYTLSANDENGCITSKEVSLEDPDQIEINLEDEEMCQGGSYPITLNLGDGYSYSWTGNNGFSSSSNSILLQDPGDYSVLATDINGCTGSDDFTLSVNNDLLNADFLLISEAYVGDTVIVIDISWPIPDQLNWTFDSEVTVISENNDYAEVVFNEQGIFTIDIETILADCQDYYSQSITILDRATKPGKNGRQASPEQLIKNFSVFPNPNDGDFEIRVELTDVAPVNIKMIDLQGNQILVNLDVNNSSEYMLPVKMPHLRPGIYIITLVSGKENKVLRILVK